MAECNYDEVTNSVYPPENPDPMYHWDAHFPERLSRLHLNVDYCPSCPPAAFLLRTGPRSGSGGRRPRDRGAGRYKTQPITFDEIAEVDDDDDAMTSSVTSPEVEAACREARAAAFRGGQGGPGFFSRSVDGLALGPAAAGSGYRPPPPPQGGSDKENTPCCCTDDDDRKRGEGQLPASFDGSVSGSDVTRHRRKRSGRRLRNRNSVPEEAPDTEKMADESSTATE